MDEHHCQKIALVQRDGLYVQHCQAHQTVELMIGAVSLRLDLASFQHLTAALTEASLKLEMLEDSHHAFERFMERMRKI